jgi:hypothetical protein
MKYLKFTYVDAVTGISVASQPAANGPALPAVDGLQFVWARESRYPTQVPEFFGTCPDESNTQIDGVLGLFLQADWEVMRADEIAARNNGLQQRIVSETQSRLDRFAQTRNYDGILSLCTYADSTVPQFASEGAYGRQARDATWATLYQILAEVEAGIRAVPSGYAEVEPLLPALEWPA